SHQPGQEIAAAAIGHQPDAGKGLNKASVVSGDTHVTGQCNITRNTGCRAVNSRNHRLWHAVKRINEAMILLQVFAYRAAMPIAGISVRKTGEILSGTKGPTRAGQDHAAHSLVAGSSLSNLRQFI